MLNVFYPNSSHLFIVNTFLSISLKFKVNLIVLLRIFPNLNKLRTVFMLRGQVLKNSKHLKTRLHVLAVVITQMWTPVPL